MTLSQAVWSGTSSRITRICRWCAALYETEQIILRPQVRVDGIVVSYGIHAAIGAQTIPDLPDGMDWHQPEHIHPKGLQGLSSLAVTPFRVPEPSENARGKIS